MNGKTAYMLVLVMLTAGLYLRGYFRFGRADIKRLGGKSREKADKLQTFVKSTKLHKRRKLAGIQREIYEGLCILRSLSAGENALNMNAESVLLKLSKRGGYLEEAYLSMLKLIRTGNNEEAARVMEKYENVIFAREYGAILADWDYTEPEELKEIILTFQRSILRKRVSTMKKRDEVISDLIYVPAVFNMMLVFINFIYVGYFLRQKEMLEGLFG